MTIETLMTFNRLKQLTTDPKVVVDAIKDSDKLAVCFIASFHVVQQRLHQGEAGYAGRRQCRGLRRRGLQG